MSTRQAQESAARIPLDEGDEIAYAVLRLVKALEQETRPAGPRKARAESHPSVVGSLAWHREVARREGLL